MPRKSKMENMVIALEENIENIGRLNKIQIQPVVNHAKLVALLTSGKVTDDGVSSVTKETKGVDLLKEFCRSVKKVDLPTFTGDDPVDWIARIKWLEPSTQMEWANDRVIVCGAKDGPDKGGTVSNPRSEVRPEQRQSGYRERGI
ncbi:hypothetical protein KIW84_054287 [Lathyrus oleraceus]|uniref:Uncharacterized protein n=1 Tax=Pisum sativum TaxID=3888 RepID=A0A9D5AI27_PEA|nr:hypothetical protein KIW84_054287 [Pisum sativum]